MGGALAVCGCRERGCSCPVFPSRPSLPTNRLVTPPRWLPEDAGGMLLQGGDKRLRYKRKRIKTIIGPLPCCFLSSGPRYTVMEGFVSISQKQSSLQTRTCNSCLRTHGEHEIGLVTGALNLSSSQKVPKLRLLETSTLVLLGQPFSSILWLPFGVAQWWLVILPISILDSLWVLKEYACDITLLSY